MLRIPKPMRIEAAFDDRAVIRTLFERHAPYRAMAAYAPDAGVDEASEHPAATILPWFRANWALGGKPLVDGAELILHNKRYLDAARALFGTSSVHPEFVVVNLNAPGPAGFTHVDVPSFHGATREHYPLPFLNMMRCSGLFEAWRVVHAGALSWFYDGAGGNFDYWPEGLEGPMLSEQPPFGNFALLSDTDSMYHRIGRVGTPGDGLPCISAAAQIQPNGAGNWAILEDGELRATYPERAIRLSVLWKAAVGDSGERADSLTLGRIMEILAKDLKKRQVEFQVPSDPLTDTEWIVLLERIYVRTRARQFSVVTASVSGQDSQDSAGTHHRRSAHPEGGVGAHSHDGRDDPSRSMI
jgi:hypothetical protein